MLLVGGGGKSREGKHWGLETSTVIEGNKSVRRGEKGVTLRILEPRKKGPSAKSHGREERSYSAATAQKSINGWKNFTSWQTRGGGGEGYPEEGGEEGG